MTSPHRMRVVAAMIGTLLLVEVLVRALPPESVAVPSIQNITLRKVEWLKKQPPADVLIVGDSTGHRGISVEAFAQASGGVRALNASITSGSPIIVRAMTEKLTWKPKRVVFTLSPFLLSDGWTSEPHEVEVASFRERDALLGAGPALLSTGWATYRRRYLMLPTLKALALGRANAADVRDFGPRVGVEDAFGSVSVKSENETFEDAAAKWRSWTKDQPRLGVRYAALEQLAATWQRDQVEVTYVLMPVHSSLRAIGEQHEEEWSFTERALKKLEAAHVLDMRASVDDDAFYDCDHLKAGPAREAFSRLLAEKIAER